MNKLDRDILLELLNKYNKEEIQKELDKYKEILNYINNTEKLFAINCEPRHFLYTEENNTQIFTNQRTSIFSLNEKTLNFEKLKLDSKIKVSQMSIAKPDELQKYFDTSKRYFGHAYSKVIDTDDKEIVCGISCDKVSFSVNECKLIRRLLKNPKIYESCENSIIYATGENGFAYVLGKTKNKQLVLR